MSLFFGEQTPGIWIFSGCRKVYLKYGLVVGSGIGAHVTFGCGGRGETNALHRTQHWSYSALTRYLDW
eukprot:5624983-Ditylum_brightwellii.AAC.1